MIYLTKYLPCIFFVLVGFIGFSQAELETEVIERADRFVFFNPGALLNIPSGFQIGYEQRIKNNWYWDVEGGILLFSKNPTLLDFNARNKKGMRFQTGVKFFATKHFFIGPQFLYKRVSMDEREWLGRYDNTYLQYFNTHRIRRTYAFAAEFGWSFDLIESPITLDIAYAIGLQNLYVRYDELPVDVSFENLVGLSTAPGTSILPFFNYKIKIKYVLGGGNSRSNGRLGSRKADTRKKKSNKQKSRK